MLKTFKEPKKIKIVCKKCGCIKLTNDYLTKEQHEKELKEIKDNWVIWDKNNLKCLKKIESLKEQHEKDIKSLQETSASIIDERQEENQKLKKQIELIIKKKGNKLGMCDWTSYCATTTNRNQCSKENCTAYSICLIKKLKEKK